MTVLFLFGMGTFIFESDAQFMIYLTNKNKEHVSASEQPLHTKAISDPIF